MRFRSLAFSLMLAILAAGLVTPVSAQAVFVTVPVPHVSARNQIIDFYAGGSSEGYSLRMSPQGGTLSINDYLAVNLTPWGYVTAQWSTERVYIIFLVNVTQTDFRIGFLYLTNSTNQPFLLRWYDYNSEGTNTWTFQGAQHVYNRTVSTPSVEVPTLRIPAAAALTNGLSALGPELYLSSKGGTLMNDTTPLRIYPLLNQFFTGANEYNEVWSLLVDPAGNYYFAILYMQNRDPSHVIIEHQLRLNDYRRFDGRTVYARWIKGDFQNHVIVRTPLPNLTVNVDGFPFQTNQNGVASTSAPNGVVTVEVPNEIFDSANSSLRFHEWNRYGAANPLSIRVNSTLDVTAKYSHEYPLVVTSAYGTPQGSAWYSQGTNATFSVESQIDYGNRTRQLFIQWQGDSNSQENQAWIILNSPKQVVASWKTQYQVTVNAIGLPPDLKAVATIGDESVTLNGSVPYSHWIDANLQLPITVQTTQIQGPNSNYYLAELRADNQTFTNAIEITKPVDVALVYTESPKLATTLSLRVLPSVAIPGIPFSISGSVNGLTGPSAPVDILYNSGSNGWQQIATIPLTQSGGFSYTWQVSAPGNYSIKASWPGDSQHSPIAQTADVKVVGSVVPIMIGSDALTQFLQTGLGEAKRVPYLSGIISFTGSLMALGYVLASFMLPGGPPIFGYFVGSMIVGFTFIFPIGALVVVARAARTKRRPSLIWLTPLLTVWLASLTLVILGPALLTPQPLVIAAQVLLIVSNVFVIPLFAAFRLGKLVA